MKYFQFYQSDEARQPAFLITTHSNVPNDLRFRLFEGGHIHAWPSDLQLWSANSIWTGEPDDVLANSVGWIIFSRRLCDAINCCETVSSDVQFLPIAVLSNSQCIGDFNVVNIVHHIACLLPEKSLLVDVDNRKTDEKTGRPRVRGIGKPAIRASAARDHNIFRLAEFPPIVIISEYVHEVLCNSNATGFACREVVAVE